MSKALSDEDLHKICGDDVKIIKYPDIIQYNTIDELLQPYNKVIILYEFAPNYGHWVSLMKHKNNVIEHWDSYGLKVDDEMKFIKKMTTKKKYITPHLTKLLYESPYEILFNEFKLQSENPKIATCGRWGAFRLVMMKYSLEEFAYIFLNNKFFKPDEYITILTNYLYDV